MKLAHCLLIALAYAATGCGGAAEDVESDTSPGQGESGPSTSPQPSSSGGRTTPKPGQGSGDSSRDQDESPTQNKESTAPACDKLELLAAPVSPEILIVLDRSGSMVSDVDRWTPSSKAVKTFTKDLTETVKFGLMLFPAPGTDPEGPNGLDLAGAIVGGILGVPADPNAPMAPQFSCEPGKIDVPVALKSAGQIAKTLDARESAPSRRGATPTAASLEAALSVLDQPPCPDCPAAGPRYVLLVTDGQPTCGAAGGGNTTPEDIAATAANIVKLKERDISTYVLGYDLGGDAIPVMNDFAQKGGTGMFLPVEDEQSLLTELRRITGSLVPCEYELKDQVPDPNFVRVQIDGKTYKYEEDWHVEGNKIVLKPEAAACSKLRDARIHDLKIVRECEPVPYI